MDARGRGELTEVLPASDLVAFTSGGQVISNDRFEKPKCSSCVCAYVKHLALTRQLNLILFYALKRGECFRN